MRKDDVATIAGNPGREATACTRLDMKATLRRTRSPANVALVVKSIGYLVPQSHFDGVVQSVYARACNISCGDSLLAVVAPDIADGPTTLLLDNHFAVDLRTCFRIGDAVARRGGRLTSREADVDLSRATAWRPHKRHVVAQDLQVLANLRITGARLAVRLQRHTSVVHREGRAVCTTLEHACRACNFEMALLQAVRLIGWGEGLTPAGDDFLVGLLAGLDALAATSALRRSFLTCLSTAIVARVGLTTPIAAQSLRLAAQGHFTADLDQLRDAVLSASDVAPLERLVDDALAVGATSGPDRVAGLLSRITAWFHPRLPAHYRP